MEPAIKRGQRVFVKPIPTEHIKVGDIITFYVGTNMTVTHRVIEIVESESTYDGPWFVTKGDANTQADEHKPDAKNVVGKVILIL